VAVRAAREQVDREAEEGRFKAHFERRMELAAALRDAYARVLGAADPHEVALTSATSDGITRVLDGLTLGAGDEVVTTEDEHPGLLGPLAVLRRRGVEVRVVPFGAVADAIGPRTRLVACSHVSWITGETAPAELAHVDVPVLLDGAQGAGAVPVDVEGLGCDAYTLSGQKWMCGSDGTGGLWVRPAFRERLDVLGGGYAALADPAGGLDAELWPDCRALDAPALPPAALAASLAAAELLAETGWGAIHARAAELAAHFADALRERGRTVRPRDATTLVSFASEDAEGEVHALVEAGVVVRHLPGRGLVRVSAGAWNDDEDLERLLAALPG
jgi:selenocysteine lyase/cysteine desulfurase